MFGNPWIERPTIESIYSRGWNIVARNLYSTGLPWFLGWCPDWICSLFHGRCETIQQLVSGTNQQNWPQIHKGKYRGTVFTSVVCLVRAGAGAVAHIVVHQALVDGAPRCATVVRTNERIRDHPGSQAALAEVPVQSRVTAPTVGTCIRTHRKGWTRCQSHPAFLTAVKLFISAASWTITVIIIQIAPGYPAASVGTLEVWCPRYHLLIGQPGGFEQCQELWKKV